MPLSAPPTETLGDDAPQSALARGIRILQCFTTAEPDLSAKDLMARTGLPKPTLLRLMMTLRQLGMLCYSERRGRYMLAPGALALAAPMLAGLTIRQLARPLMQSLADAVHGQVSIALGEGPQFCYVELVQGAGSTVFSPEIGTPVSLTRTASGRAYLTLVDPLLRADLIAQRTGKDAEKRDALLAKLERTSHELATEGFCRNQGDLSREVLSVAVPARTTARDEQQFIFGCSVPVFHRQDRPDLLDHLGLRLVSLVHSVETAMGNGRS